MSSNENIRPIANADIAIAHAKKMLQLVDDGKINGDPLLLCEAFHNLAHTIRPFDAALAQELMLAGDDFLQASGGDCF